MALTPVDVQQKTFGTALRGYNLDEVDDFLDEVVTTLASYEQRLKEAQERVDALEKEVTDRGDAESAISRALVAAQRSADAIVAEAETKAETVLAEAQAESGEIRRRREREEQDLVSEVTRMRELVNDLRRDVRRLAASVEGDLQGVEAAAAATLRELTGDGRTALAEPATSGFSVLDEVPELDEVWESEEAEESASPEPAEAPDEDEVLDQDEAPDEYEGAGPPTESGWAEDADTLVDEEPAEAVTSETEALVDLSEVEPETPAEPAGRTRRPWERD